MSVLYTEPKDPPHFLFPSMTDIEDRILRHLHRCGGQMESEALRAGLVPAESVDDVYGALCALHEMGYLEADIIDWHDWSNLYRPLRLTITPRGRLHVLGKEPVRAGGTRDFISLVLVGALVAAAQATYKEPDYGLICLAVLAALVVSTIVRRVGKLMTKKGDP